MEPYHSHPPTQPTQKLWEDQLVSVLEMEHLYMVEEVPCTAACSEQGVPLAEWRGKICQWSFRVIDHFRLDRSLVASGMNILDRFLVSYQPQHSSNMEAPNQRNCNCPSCRRILDSQTYQLAAMTCMYLAIKVHIDDGSNEDALRRKEFKLEAFADLSRGMFRQEDICEMELVVLKTVGWKVFPPTAMTFVSYLLSLMPPRELFPELSRSRYNLVVHVLRELSRYLTEISVFLGNDCPCQQPSQVAFAAILVSMDLITLHALPQAARDAFSQRVQELCSVPRERILLLQERLKKTLGPEMLLGDCDAGEGHPISMARDCGMLRISHIVEPSSPVAAPRKQWDWQDGQDSPVSAMR
jgi:hypothetical protein